MLGVADLVGASLLLMIREIADIRACAGVKSGFSLCSLATRMLRTSRSLAPSACNLATASGLAATGVAPATPASTARSASSAAFTSFTVAASLARRDISAPEVSSSPSFRPSSERSKMPPCVMSMSSPARSVPRSRMLAIFASKDATAFAASFGFMLRPRTIMPRARPMSVRVMPLDSSGWVNSRN